MIPRGARDAWPPAHGQACEAGPEAAIAGARADLRDLTSTNHLGPNLQQESPQAVPRCRARRAPSGTRAAERSAAERAVETLAAAVSLSFETSASYFDPCRDERRMKEWIELRGSDPSWIELAREACRFVRGKKA